MGGRNTLINASPDIIIVFLSASIFLILLYIVVIFLPRLLREKKTELKNIETNTVIGAFHALGNEIKSLKEQLIVKERLAALGEISAGIAHEFRNPMGVIAGYAKLLLKGFDDSDKRREIAQGILREIEEMNSIMEELLSFSRSEPINKVGLDMAETIKDIVKNMGDASQKIDLSFSGRVQIKGDETLLRQAIKNLLKNAMDAGDKVWIEVSPVRKSLSNGDRSQNAGVYIIVRDNGRGIPEKDINKIFMPFYTTKEGGVGIGLALVQKIVMGHGGNISVESKEGEGSTFRMFLPAE